MVNTQQAAIKQLKSPCFSSRWLYFLNYTVHTAI